MTYLVPFTRTRSTSEPETAIPTKMNGRLSDPVGSCDSAPGPLTYVWGDQTAGIAYQSSTKTMTDVVTPGFKALSSQGKIINNPMTKTITEIHDGVTTINISYMIQVYGCTPSRWINWRQLLVAGTRTVSSLVSYLPKPTIDIQGLQDLAVSEAWANSADSEILLLSMLAELNGTISSMTDILRGVYSIHKAVRRADFRYLRKLLTLKNLEDIYMNARYNLRPLYYDALGVLDIVNNVSKHVERQTYRASSSKQADNSASGSSEYFSHANNIGTIYWQKLAKRKVTMRAGVLCQLDPLTLMNQCGVGLIAETLWDLTPYSFIIDWFCNAGNTLLAWTPKPGVKALASWIVSNDETFYSSTVTGLKLTPGLYGGYQFINHNGSATPAAANKLETVITRVPSPSRPIIPTWNVRLDPLKLLDLGIIIKNVLFTK